MRATLPDRPGTLAALAHECGKAGVNIVGMQLFRGAEAATVELVVEAPDTVEADLVDLVHRGGAQDVESMRCTEAALTDQPTRYVNAARAVLTQPSSFPDVAAHLFDADVAPAKDHSEDVMVMTLGEDVEVQIRRATPFTDTERARGAAFAELVAEVLERQARPSTGVQPGGHTPEYVVGDGEVTALANGHVVGRGRIGAADPEAPDARNIDLEVNPGWRRHGVGTRLLKEIVKMACAQGIAEIVVTAPADSRAALPMVLAAGLRGRIRIAGDSLTVRISLAEPRRI
jgi:GNAT superfamily N-acetyltransferase